VPVIRLLTVTSLFPNSAQPRHGIFVANRLQHLCDTGRVAATVIAPIAAFPGAYRSTAGVPAAETIHGFSVAHPRYANVPGIGMRLQPDLLARALLKHVRHSGNVHADVIDAHYFYPDGVAAMQLADALGLPLVITARGSDINLVGGIRSARRRIVQAAERAQALIAVSEALARKMVALGMPAERICVLRNGVDARLFRPIARSDARRALGLDVRCAWLLGVGNLVPEKGFDLLIRSIALLPDARLLLVGEGPSARALGSLADAVAPGRVEFRRSMPQSDLRLVYAAADVLCLPSLREGWPNVLLESLACGTPVVAAAVGGVPEIVQSGVAGTIVAQRTPEAWAAAIRAQLLLPPSPDAVAAYATKFGWDEVITRQCALYEDVVARWRPPVATAPRTREVSHA
jgi:glycosyltransferase involved in cell wall biosynthesis